jgi:hypothetical protein
MKFYLASAVMLVVSIVGMLLMSCEAETDTTPRPASDEYVPAPLIVPIPNVPGGVTILV